MRSKTIAIKLAINISFITRGSLRRHDSLRRLTFFDATHRAIWKPDGVKPRTLCLTENQYFSNGDDIKLYHFKITAWAPPFGSCCTITNFIFVREKKNLFVVRWLKSVKAAGSIFFYSFCFVKSRASTVNTLLQADTEENVHLLLIEP